MKESLKKIAFWSFVYLFLGALVACGMRAAEWLIPKPEARIVVCMATDDAPICKRLDEVITGRK